MARATVDADAFNAFEAAGWERQAAGYQDFFAPITTKLVEPLLDAAHVGRGDTTAGRCLRSRSCGRREPPRAVRRS